MNDFEEHLMIKYPNLFPKDKDGNTLYSDCGIGGLESWEPIIEEMCNHINYYCSNYSLVPTKNIWLKINYKLYHGIFYKIYNLLSYFLDPYKGIVPKEIRKSKTYTIKPEWKKKAEKTKKYKLHEKLSRFYYLVLLPKNFWQKSFPPKLTLIQIKTKFNSARIYVSGGDRYTNGVVNFTENLCNQIIYKKLEIKKL